MKKKKTKSHLIRNLLLIILGIGISILLALSFTNLDNSEEPAARISEKIVLNKWCGNCKGDGNMMCGSVGKDYAKGRFVDCSLKTEEPFPNNSIRGRISQMNYEIDRKLFLKIAKEQEFPIICDFKRRPYSSLFPRKEGSYCKSNMTKLNGDSYNSNYKAYCFFSNYCASWGNVHNLCTCDDSLDYKGELTEVTCQSKEGKQECKCS